jgi:hypothetical protein
MPAKRLSQNFILLIILMLIFISGLAQISFAQKPSLILYDTESFCDSSAKVILDADVLNLKILGFNDRAESVKLIGGLVSAALFEHANFQGKCLTVTSNIPDLKATSIGSNTISSVKLNATCENLLQSFQQEKGAILYEHINFQGNKILIKSNHPDLRMDGFNDKASSIKLVNISKAAVYEDINFNGKCQTITGDTPSLIGSSIGNDSISSVKPGEECKKQIMLEVKSTAWFITRYVIEYSDGRIEKNISSGLTHKYNFAQGERLYIKAYYINGVDSPFAWGICDLSITMYNNKKLNIKGNTFLQDPSPADNLCSVEEIP